MKLFNKYSAAALGIIAFVAMTPSTAMARGSLHLDLPGLSINVHDGHRRHHRKRYRHRDRYYYDDYHRGYRGKKYHRERRHHRRKHRRQYDNYYYDNQYYSGRNNRRNYNYSRPRRGDVCPNPGYSRYYQNNGGCYRHEGHYHCEG